MIHYVITDIAPFAIGDYLLGHGRALVDRLCPVTYQELARRGELAPGTYVFSDVDRLQPAERELAAHIVDRLEAAPDRARILNDPRRAMRRFELLDAMERSGVNHFRVFRVSALGPDLISEIRFPVFLREEVEHTGALTGLIHTPGELRRSVRAMRLCGYAPEALLIVEQCDTADEDGIYRKYAAVIVGEHIHARWMMFSRQWMVKEAALVLDDAKVAEEIAYVEGNPHEAWLRDVFRIAGIDYGRIDYGIAGDDPQVWEINFNPRVGAAINAPTHRDRTERRLQALREPITDHFYPRFQASWESIDLTVDDATPIPLDLDAALAHRVETACRQRQRRWFWLRGIARIPGSRWTYRRGLPWAARLLCPSGG